MKLEYIDDQNFYLYLNKHYISDMDFDDKQRIESYFRKIFINLKNNYHLDIYGYYNIRVYVNNQYGLIIDVFKLNNDYFKIPSNKVDMKIMVDKNTIFLYEIDDYFFAKNNIDNIKTIYYKDDKYYLELNDKVDDHFYLHLIEHSNIIFNDDAYEIIALSSKL